MKRALWIFALLSLFVFAPGAYAGECEGDECSSNCDEEQIDSSLVCDADCVYSEAWGSLCEGSNNAGGYCWQVFVGSHNPWPYACHEGSSDPCCDADGGGGEEGAF